MKTYAEMTPEERLKDRIAKNKAIDERIKALKTVPVQFAGGTRSTPLVCGIRRIQAR